MPIVPSRQVICRLFELGSQVPCVGTDETKVTPLGSLSVTTTWVAVAGPALRTWIEYAIGLPATTGSGESDLVTETSAESRTGGAPLEAPVSAASRAIAAIVPTSPKRPSGRLSLRPRSLSIPRDYP